jgi:hypothetical protein
VTSSTVTSASSLPYACPALDQNIKTESIINGTICIGQYNDQLGSAGYYYYGGPSTVGHVELGNGYNLWPGGACDAGTAFANTSNVTMTSSYYEEYISAYNLVYGGEYTGTWWDYNGSSYSNWGTVCGTWY